MLFTWSAGGPTPFYINNDRSLTLIYFEWRDTENQLSTSKEIRIHRILSTDVKVRTTSQKLHL